jgi:3-oxoadipate enol-lactonase
MFASAVAARAPLANLAASRGFASAISRNGRKWPPPRRKQDIPRMPIMKLDRGHFNVELAGSESAPPLMLSYSLGTNLGMWDDQMPELAKRFHVIRYDSRGHGKSTAESPYSIAGLAADALAILDQLGLKKVHWLGLSKGGMVGQWLLTHAPQRLRKTILANTAAHMPPANNWNGRIRTVHAKGMKAITPAVIERWFTPEFRQREPAKVARIAAMLHATPAAGYAGCCAAIRDMDQRESLRAIEAKDVLVITGARDPATPATDGDLIRHSIKGTKGVSLDAAHLSNIEQPQAFTRAVLEFLA